VEQELADLPRRSPAPAAAAPAPTPQETRESDWAAFEARQELQELKRRMGQ
jgi:hypothetical protein